jgi:predicted short-subunit dehydrogenase-like oxidoreductase (DUF2520 family)
VDSRSLGPDGGSDRPAVSPRRVGIVGAGSVGTALAVAISRAGWPVTSFCSRDAARREQFAGLLPEARPVGSPADVAALADLTFLTVPDDAIAAVAAGLRLGPERTLVHTSGLLGAEVMRAAGTAHSATNSAAHSGGPAVAAFHPLVSFTADVERSVAALRGATVAIDGDEAAVEELAALAGAIGASPLRLPRWAKPFYHAAAVLASGGLIALLDAIAALGEAAGMGRAESVAVYGRLIEQTLANARAIGITPALTGPIVRGDTGTLESHLAAIEAAVPDVLEIYLAASRRELEIAEERGALSPGDASCVSDVLAKDRRPGTICG